MGIGDVFAKAWELWRRDVGWLILAGLVVGLIMMVVFGIAFAIFGAIFAGAGLTFGANLANDTSSSVNGVGVGLVVLGFIVYMVAMFLIQVVSLAFYGGMFEMVIGASRGNRGVQFGDLFSGFRRFGAYAVFALVMFGISLGLNLVSVIIPVVGWLIGLVVMTWVYVLWLYVLPLIADQGLGFGEAAGQSNAMVKGVGWWRTFGMVFLLGIVVVAAILVIVLVAAGIARGSEGAGLAFGIILFLAFAILVPPYTICYVSVMYLGSGGAVAAVPGGGLPGIPPAPPAPPAATGYGAPAAPSWAAPAAGAATAVTAAGAPAAPGAPVAPPPGVDAWKVAADPLAKSPPAPPPVPAADAPVAAADAADDAGTAVTEATPAGAPEPPVPPAPPAPPPPPGSGA